MNQILIQVLRKAEDRNVSRCGLKRRIDRGVYERDRPMHLLTQREDNQEID